MCFNRKDFLNLTKSCKFEEKFNNCQIKLASPKLFTLFSPTQYFKGFQYLIEVFLKPILCLIGMVTNSMTMIVLKNKKMLKLFNKPMYHFMFINSFFNLTFCLITSFSLINVCIFPITSFCSGIYKTVFSQYYKKYILNFFGESICMCCNFSYFAFSISRFYVSTTTKEKGYFLKKFIALQQSKYCSVLHVVFLVCTLHCPVHFSV